MGNLISKSKGVVIGLGVSGNLTERGEEEKREKSGSELKEPL